MKKVIITSAMAICLTVTLASCSPQSSTRVKNVDVTSSASQQHK